MKVNQLRTRIISYFVGISLFISVLYGVTSFIFSYNVEDHFFSALLNAEAEVVSQQHNNHLAPQPRLEFISFHESIETMPIFIGNELRESPSRTEFSTEDGKHYHLVTFEHGYLLAEVSDYLVVRNIKQVMLSYLAVLVAIVVVIASLGGIAAYRIARRLFEPLDELANMVKQAPVDKLPQGFAKRYKQHELANFANVLETALARIQAFISREQHFTRDVSHELRTPLTVGQGAISLLKQTQLQPNQQSLIDRIEQSQLQMEQSLSSLLAIAREDNNSDCRTRLLPVVEQSILQQHVLLADKSVELFVDIAPQVEVNTASEPLLILLNNIISNAFKYTRSGTVTICYQHSILSVIDSGDGAAPELLARIFEEGIKGPDSTGLGMGLNIVKRLCERYGIVYNIKSAPQGTEFTLLFDQS